jgi:hypothetical protein
VNHRRRQRGEKEQPDEVKPRLAGDDAALVHGFFHIARVSRKCAVYTTGTKAAGVRNLTSTAGHAMSAKVKMKRGRFTLWRCCRCTCTHLSRCRCPPARSRG